MRPAAARRADPHSSAPTTAMPSKTLKTLHESLIGLVALATAVLYTWWCFQDSGPYHWLSDLQAWLLRGSYYPKISFLLSVLGGLALTAGALMLAEWTARPWRNNKDNKGAVEAESSTGSINAQSDTDIQVVARLGPSLSCTPLPWPLAEIAVLDSGQVQMRRKDQVVEFPLEVFSAARGPIVADTGNVIFQVESPNLWERVPTHEETAFFRPLAERRLQLQLGNDEYEAQEVWDSLLALATERRAQP